MNLDENLIYSNQNLNTFKSPTMNLTIEMTVSIIMPTYNGQRFLRETLDSILRQTYRDWELIVCDDKSTDNTVEIVQEYANNHEQIHLHRFEHYGNPAVLRNKGIELAKGKYIALCDQDDLWAENKLELQVSIMKDTGKSNIKFVSGASSIINSEGTVIQGGKNTVFDLAVKKAQDLGGCVIIPPMYLILGNFIMNSSVLISRDIYNTIGFYKEDQSYRGIEDYEFILRYLSSGYKICFIKEPIAYWRQHESNLTKDVQSSQRLEIILSEILEALKSDSFKEHQKWLLIQQRISYLQMEIARSRYSESPSQTRKIMKFYKKQRFRFYKLLGKLSKTAIY